MTRHLSDCDGNGWVDCWDCDGEGGYHDCGEDCCCCADPDEITHHCATCRGTGRLNCPGCIADNIEDGGPFTGGGE